MIYFWNISEGWVLPVANYSPEGPLNPIVGTGATSSAEWIIEPTNVNGGVGPPPPLADYGTATMTNASAMDFSGGSHNPTTDTPTTLVLVDDAGAPLSTASVTSSTVSFTWLAYQ